MKNFILSVIIILVGSAVVEWFFAWYFIALAAFAAGFLIKQSGGAAFLAGFVAVFLLWVSYAFMLSHANGDLLAHKVANLLPLHGSVPLLLLITGLIGGMVSGFGALTGNLAAKL